MVPDEELEEHAAQQEQDGGVEPGCDVAARGR
jgi:hypothetical protein